MNQNRFSLLSKIDLSRKANIMIFYSRGDSMIAYVNIKKNYFPDNAYGYKKDTIQGVQILRIPLNDQFENNSSRTIVAIAGYPPDTLEASFDDHQIEIMNVNYKGKGYKANEIIEIIK